MNEEVKFETDESSGTLTQEPANENKESEVNKILCFAKKNMKWIGIAAAALVVICILASFLLNSDRYQRTEDVKNRYFQQDDDVLMNLAGNVIECDEDISYVKYSADNSLTAVMDDDATLWIVKGKKLVQVDEDVEWFWISTYGDTIVYMKDIKSDTGDLFLYQVSNGKSTELSTKADRDSKSVIMSPNGKSVAFLEVDKKGNEVLMVSKNGKEAEELEKSAFLCGISDNAKYVYYIKDDKFYVNDEKIDSKSLQRVYFNADYTEVLYNTSDGAAMYFTVKSGKSDKVDKETVRGIGVPSDVVTENNRNVNIRYIGVDTFDNTVIGIGGGLYYMHNKGEKIEKITSSCNSYQMSEDGKSLLFSDNGKLFYVKNVAQPGKAEKYKKLDVDYFYASKDLKTVYVINEDDELCYFNKGEGVVIAKDIYVAAYSDAYNVIYFLDDDELCYANKTKKSVKTITDDVSSLYLEGDYVVFELDDETCVMTGKNKYKNLEE